MKTVALLAPLSGLVVPLDRVPDPVFAQKMVGDGASIDPTSHTLRAPCDGEVLLVHAAGHAVNLKTADGLEVLMHIGLETVSLKGEGFLPRVRPGQHVRAGDPLIDFSPDYVATHARSLITPILVTTMERVASLVPVSGSVEAARDVIAEVTVRDVAPVAAPASGPAPSLEREVLVRNPAGLHARPAAMLASAARAFDADIGLRRGNASANAKSVTSIMALEIALNDRVVLSASGDDARKALDALIPLIEAGLGEGPAAARPATEQAPPVAATRATAPSSSRASEAGLLRAAGVSPGIGIGRIHQWRPQDLTAALPAGTPEQEREKLESALARARAEIAALRDSAPRGDASAGIFTAHLELLEDPDLVDACREMIAGGTGAAVAWQRSFAKLAERIAASRNEMFAGRAADVRDVGRRVLRFLAGVEAATPVYPDGAILVARELSPSDTVSLDRSRVQGFCTVAGGRTSHVAILARSLQIPAIAGIAPEALSLPDGTPAILDGMEGTLKLAPSESELAAARAAQDAVERKRRADLEASAGAAATRDGYRVEVVANLGADGDAAQALAFGAEGVGLLRSEFLFMDRPEAPSEDEQYEAYATVAKALGPERPLIIRTLDVGGDKPLAYLPIPREENPFLGVRGIRLSAMNPEMLRAQLRAILRAAAHGRVHVMFPMIATIEDWRFGKALLDEERGRLGVPAVPAGLMIEVPSAALLADRFAADAEFFSVGTNDLTQYTLAVDRGHATLANVADSLHPAVLRLIDMTVRGARKSGRWVGVCGDLASDPAAVPILVGLGVRELSANPPAVPSVKAAVRARTLDECRSLATRALAASSAGEVRSLP